MHTARERQASSHEHYDPNWAMDISGLQKAVEHQADTIRKCNSHIMEQEAEIDSLRAQLAAVQAECLRLQADLGHGRDERVKLRAALLTCSELASGKHHMIPSDRCAAICTHVDMVLNKRAKKEVGDE